jgi:colanic acid/amylovoran biosynthesis glycosyltransferase
VTGPPAGPGERPITVLHSAATWLSPTMPWLRDIVTLVPPHIVCHVVAQQVKDPHRSAVERLHLPRKPGRTDRIKRRVRRLLGRPVTRRRHIVAVAIRLRPDIVHSHFGGRGWSDRGAVRRVGARHVTSFYGFDVDYLPRKLPVWRERYGDLFSSVQRVLVLGPRMAERLRELGCPDAKLAVHHVGVDTADVAFRPRRWTTTEPLRILMAASFRPKKGLPLGIEAVARLRSRVPVAVTIIGDAGADPRGLAEKAILLETIERCGMRDHVRMLGYQPRSVLFEEAYAHDVLLAPSLTDSDGDAEGTPVVLMDMMASGMPVVSTSHSDIPEIVEHGRTGRLAPEGDVDGLVRELEWLVDHADGWSGMVAAARSHIEQEFDARRQGQRLAALYGELLGR